MKCLLYPVLLLGFFPPAYAQTGLGVYHDYMNNFHVFDNGVEYQIESNPVTDVKIGNDYIAYTDSKKSFVSYYKGQTVVLEENLPNKVIATPNALVYQMQQRLMICEKGEKKMLSRNTDKFTAGDSIIIWQALPSMNYMSYENNEIKTIIYAVNSNVINDYKVGNNIMAFTDLDFNLKIYFKGKTYDTESTRINSYECGHNIVAFIDEFKNTFNVFYNGELKVISKEIIEDFKVSNDMVAFVDAKENFCIFYEGAITKIDSRKPDYYFARGNILYYSFDSELKFIYNGDIYSEPLIDRKNILSGNNSLLYFSNINRPKYFYKGTIFDSFYVQKPYTMNLNQDLPVFKYNNTIGFLFNGKIYEFNSRSNN